MKRPWTFPLIAAAAGLLLAPAASAQNAAAIGQGAQVWGQQCVRCHTARAAGEYTDRQWATVVLHMRARANLTREEARLVTLFLQETNEPVGTQRTADTIPEAEKQDTASTDTDAEARVDREETGVWLAFFRYLNRLRSP